MPKVAIVTDSSCDLTPEEAQQYGIHVIPNTIVMNGEPKKEGVEVTRQTVEFFMEQGGLLETIPVSPEEFSTAFEKLLRQYDEIVCILVSSNLSKNYSNAVEAVRTLGKERQIRIYDSRITTIAMARMALRAKQVAEEGGNMLAVIDALNTQRDHLIADAVVPSLKYFRRGKRVTASRAIIATLLRLCPVMAYTDEGQLVNARTVRGKDGISSLVGNIESRYGNQPIAVTIGLAGEDPEQIERMRQAVQASPTLNIKHLQHKAIGPTISAHSGPGLYGYVVEPYLEGMIF